MIGLYLAVGIVGVGLVLLAALGGLLGHHDMDNSAEAHMASDHDVSHDDAQLHDVASKTFDKGVEAAHGAGLWLPFFTLRFWTGMAAGFGLYGTLATFLKVSAEPLTLIVSLLAGAVVGTGSALLYRTLQLQQKDSTTKAEDLLGVEGRLLVGAKGHDLGKVRLSVRGELIDMLAVSQNGQDILEGEEVIVVGIEGSNAQVLSKREILS